MVRYVAKSALTAQEIDEILALAQANKVLLSGVLSERREEMRRALVDEISANNRLIQDTVSEIK